MELTGKYSWFARTSGPVLLVFALLSGSTATLAQTHLKSRRDFVVGVHPVAAVSVDFDADGSLDLITVNQLSGTDGDIGLLKGFGDGTFRQVGTIVAGLLPAGVAFADATGDGRPDLIVANFQSRDVTVHPGDGMGGFGAKIVTGVLGRPSGIAVGDWNGDNKIDIATVNDANFTTMLGDGTGHFGTLRQFTTGTIPRQIVAADFALSATGTSDGILDLAVVNNGSNTIQIFQGNGTGVFTLLRTLTTETGPFSMAVGLFNADTRLDVAVTNYSADTVGTFLANTTGSFGSQTTRTTGFGPRSIAVADINADAKVDLIVGQALVSNVGEVATLTGDGLGGFTVQPLAHTSPKPNVVLIGDYNQDGKPDVAALSLTGDAVSILPNAGTAPMFADASKITLGVGAFPHGVGVLDLNLDGKLDVVTSNQGDDNVSRALGDGSCGFGSLSNTATGATPNAIVIADFNRDGCADVVTPNNLGDTMSYLRSNCTGGFASSTQFPAGCLAPVAAASGDINGDLDNDVVLVCEGSSQICSRQGTGTGTFGAPVCSSVLDVPAGVAVGSFNLDLFDDAAISYAAQSFLSTCISNGSGGCTEYPPATFQTGAGPQGMARRDINGDGFVDLVVANSADNTISAMLGDGGGIFYFPPIPSATALAPSAVVLDDFNQDGKIDAAVANTSANNVSLMLGDGFGHFTKAGDYGTRAFPVSIAAGDCNGDGKPDLMVADNFDDSITVLINQSTPADGLQMLSADDGARTILRWGIVPGGAFDVVRGLVKSVTQGPTTFNLGPVTCLANDIMESDTASFPDSANPPAGDAFFYLVRATVGGVPGNYTVAVPSGMVGVPSSGGCP